MRNFILISLTSISLTILTKILLNLEGLLSSSLSSNFSTDQTRDILIFQKKWQWVSYLIIPLFLLIKTTLIASVLYVGTFFYSKVKVTFKQLWNVAVKAEFVFLLVGVAKIIWFYFFQTNYTLEDLQFFYPLSALNIVGYKGLESYFIYPFQVLNLFELAYVLLLGYYVGKLAYTPKNKGLPMEFGLKIVMSSYVPALFLWVAIVMFFTLSYS
jgi:hypothetical protein